MDQHVWDQKVHLNPLVPKPNTIKEPYTLSGASVAAHRTGFKIGSFRLDAGHSVFDSWAILLISHGHADHTFSICSFLLADHEGEPRPIYTPEKTILPLADGACSILRANYGHDFSNAEICRRRKVQFMGASPGQTLQHDDYIISVYRMDHHVPTVGYGISKRVKGINPAIGVLLQKYPTKTMQIMTYLKGRNIIPELDIEDLVLLQELVGQPTEVYNTYPQFCYLTDTSIKGITDNLVQILPFPIKIVECTFYDNEDMEHAINKYHMHWNFLEPIMLQDQASLYVLIHYSKKYLDLPTIMSILERQHDKDWTLPSNILIWQ